MFSHFSPQSPTSHVPPSLHLWLAPCITPQTCRALKLTTQGARKIVGTMKNAALCQQNSFDFWLKIREIWCDTCIDIFNGKVYKVHAGILNVTPTMWSQFWFLTFDFIRSNVILCYKFKSAISPLQRQILLSFSRKNKLCVCTKMNVVEHRMSSAFLKITIHFAAVWAHILWNALYVFSSKLRV